MTKTAQRANTRERARNIAFLTAAMFLVVFTLLAWRLAAGEDPAIGSPVAQATAQPVVKRQLIVKRKVIVTVVEDPPAATSSGSGSATSAAPAQSYSAPQASAPAPAAAPAPAPAPAPTTSAS